HADSPGCGQKPEPGLSHGDYLYGRPFRRETSGSADAGDGVGDAATVDIAGHRGRGDADLQRGGADGDTRAGRRTRRQDGHGRAQRNVGHGRDGGGGVTGDTGRRDLDVAAAEGEADGRVRVGRGHGPAVRRTREVGDGERG